MLGIEPFTMNYSGANAHALAELCSIAALPHDERLKCELPGWNLQLMSAADASLTPRALMATNEDAIVVAFDHQVEEPLERWPDRALSEVNQSATPYIKGDDLPTRAALNAGLYSSFAEIWQRIFEKLRTVRRKSIFLTGHGVGGAYAVLAALALRSHNLLVHGVYTFGQLRVLNRGAAFWLQVDFGAHIFRVVNNNDLVALCPFRKDGYSHVGTLVFFESSGQLHSDRYWWFKLLSDFDESPEELSRLLKVPASGIRDHAIERYLELTLRHRDHGLRP